MKHKIAMAALKDHPAYLTTISKETLTYDMIVSTLENTGSALFYLKEKQKTIHLCAIAVSRCGMALGSVPMNYRIPIINTIARKDDRMITGCIPLDLQQPETYIGTRYS